ncbi:MAG: HNH endonuclease signature motif containing protein, partial [Pedococcus sp.]
RRPGMARWHVLMPTAVSQEVYAAVDALAAQYARSQPGTPIDGHRADALADLVLANAQVQTTVELVVPVLAARGRDTGDAPGDVAVAVAVAVDQLNPMLAALTRPSSGLDTAEVCWVVPGSVDLPRHGALLPAVVAELLSRPETLVRLARLDPDGSIVQDPRTYRPSASLRRRLRSRDGTCRFPGCATPAERCDLDHVVPFPVGLTTPGNLISLCRTHHRFKHHGGWRAELRADATVAWTAPDGRVHLSTPRPLRIAQDLDLTDRVDRQVAHDVRRGWLPGLPVGMSLADLDRAESLLPDEPPPPDEGQLADEGQLGDEWPPTDEPPPADEWSLAPSTRPPAPEASRLERHLTQVLALAA